MNYKLCQCCKGGFHKVENKKGLPLPRGVKEGVLELIPRGVIEICQLGWRRWPTKCNSLYEDGEIGERVAYLGNDKHFWYYWSKSAKR